MQEGNGICTVSCRFAQRAANEDFKSLSLGMKERLGTMIGLGGWSQKGGHLWCEAGNTTFASLSLKTIINMWIYFEL